MADIFKGGQGVIYKCGQEGICPNSLTSSPNYSLTFQTPPILVTPTSFSQAIILLHTQFDTTLLSNNKYISNRFLSLISHTHLKVCMRMRLSCVSSLSRDANPEHPRCKHTSFCSYILGGVTHKPPLIRVYAYL